MAEPVKKLTATIEGEFLVIWVPFNPTPTEVPLGNRSRLHQATAIKQPSFKFNQGKPVFVGVNAYIV